jgi:pyruvate formate lyase activating enzyme
MSPETAIGRIKGFVETSFVDWPGRVCSVIFVGGCNFRCPYCHNHRLVLDPDGQPDLSWSGILGRLHQLRGWVDGVCITGGEPTLHAGLASMARELKANDLSVKLDTNGSRPEVIDALTAEGLLDAVAMDIKAPLRFEAYARCGGTAVPLAAVRRSIALLGASGLEVEFRTTVVPDYLSEADVVEIAASLPPEIPYRLQTFRSEEVLHAELKDRKPYTDEELEMMRSRIAAARQPGQRPAAADPGTARCRDPHVNGRPQALPATGIEPRLIEPFSPDKGFAPAQTRVGQRTA